MYWGEYRWDIKWWHVSCIQFRPHREWSSIKMPRPGWHHVTARWLLIGSATTAWQVWLYRAFLKGDLLRCKIWPVDSSVDLWTQYQNEYSSLIPNLWREGMSPWKGGEIFKQVLRTPFWYQVRHPRFWITMMMLINYWLRGSMTTRQKIEIIVFMYSFSPTLALHKMFFISMGHMPEHRLVKQIHLGSYQRE